MLEKSMKARKGWRSSRVIAGVLAAGALSACTGAISEPQGGTRMGSPTGSSGSEPDHTDITRTDTVIGESAGPLVMRRLTYREYDHMMTELLGDTTSPASGANSWSPDAPADTGFISPNSVASYHVVQYNQTAETLVDAA